MACAMVLAPLHFHAPTDAHLEAFLSELDREMGDLLTNLLKVHSNVELVDGPPTEEDDHTEVKVWD